MYRTLKLIFSILSLIWTVSYATAQEYVAPGHYEYHQWYQDIQQELGIDSCCDEESQDCGPVAKFEDRGSAGVYVWLEDGNKYEFDGQKKYYVKTPDGRAHVCRLPDVNNFGFEVGGFIFYCIFLPKPTG